MPWRGARKPVVRVNGVKLAGEDVELAAAPAGRVVVNVGGRTTAATVQVGPM